MGARKGRTGALPTLTDEAIVGLMYLQRYRFLSVSQFARASGLKPSWATELLRTWERHGLLGHFGNVPYGGRGKTPKLYYLKEHGYELLRNEAEVPAEHIGSFRQVHVTVRWSPIMAHRLATIDCMIALECGVRERPQYNLVRTWIEYRRVKRGLHFVRETSDLVAEKDVSTNRIVPDAAFVLENRETTRRGLFFVEIDMGTETLQRKISGDITGTVEHKLRQYDRYLESGRYAERYKRWGSFDHFRLLFITTTATRLENARRETRGLSDRLDQYYLFGVLPEVIGNFFNEQWKSGSPGDTKNYRIVR